MTIAHGAFAHGAPQAPGIKGGAMLPCSEQLAQGTCQPCRQGNPLIL